MSATAGKIRRAIGSAFGVGRRSIPMALALGALWLLPGPATQAQETSPTTTLTPPSIAGNQARRIGGVLEELYPKQNIETKFNKIKKSQQPTTDSQALATAMTTGSATRKTTPTLVVRRPKAALPPVDGKKPHPNPARRNAATSTSQARLAAHARDGATTPTMTNARTRRADRPTTGAAQNTLVGGVDLGRPLPQAATPQLTPLAPAPESPVSQPPMPQVMLAPTSATLPVQSPAAVRLNKADARELMQKLKIDARRARLIIEFRELYGRFHRPEDLDQVSGITDDMIQRWEEQQVLQFN